MLFRSLELAEKIGDIEERIQTLSATAEVLVKQGKFAEAVVTCDRAFDLAGNHEADLVIPRLLRIKGDALLAAGRETEAIESLMRARVVAERYDPNELQRINETLNSLQT